MTDREREHRRSKVKSGQWLCLAIWAKMRVLLAQMGYCISRPSYHPTPSGLEVKLARLAGDLVRWQHLLLLHAVQRVRTHAVFWAVDDAPQPAQPLSGCERACARI